MDQTTFLPPTRKAIERRHQHLVGSRAKDFAHNAVSPGLNKDSVEQDVCPCPFAGLTSRTSDETISPSPISIPMASNHYGPWPSLHGC